jgi:DNA-3-methyladenine glycosylase I
LAQLIRLHDDGLARCSWAWPDPLYVEYHDSEWGVELKGQPELFERLALEAFQAGLSWLTILKRRAGFREAFADFRVEKVAGFTEEDVQRLLQNPKIIRNELKIRAVIANAQLVLEKRLDLTQLIWRFAPTQRETSMAGFSWVATSPESEALSKELRSIGFKFVGPTTMYALMQSIGMVVDHAPGCFRRG